MVIRIEKVEGKVMFLKVFGENFHDDVKFVKENLIGRKWDPSTKCWAVPILKKNFATLKKAGAFEDDDALWDFEEDERLATYAKAEREGDLVALTSYYDEEVLEIIRAHKSDADRWDKSRGAWLLTLDTWKALKPELVDFLEDLGEKYDFSA